MKELLISNLISITEPLPGIQLTAVGKETMEGGAVASVTLCNVQPFLRSTMHEGMLTLLQTSTSFCYHCSCWSYPITAVFKYWSRGHFLLRIRIFLSSSLTGVKRWPGSYKLHRQSSCSAWLVWRGSVFCLFVFLVSLLLSLAHQHFLPREPTGFQLFPSFQVVLSRSFASSQFFRFHALFAGWAKVIWKWVRGGMSCLLPLLVSMEEVATSLCGLIWFRSAAIKIYFLHGTIGLRSWCTTVHCLSQVHRADKERSLLNVWSYSESWNDLHITMSPN